jgi:hypothetical protein
VTNAPAAPVGSEFQVNQQPTGLTAPSADSAADASGNFVVAWEANNDTVVQLGDAPGIEAALYDPGGNLQMSIAPVNAVAAQGQSSPSVAMNATTSEFVIVWQDENDGGNGIGVYAQRYNSTGGPVGGRLQVPQDPLNDQLDPQVAMADDGSFMVAWFEQTSDSIEMRLFDSAGAPITTLDVLVSEVTTNNSAPAIGVSSGAAPQFVVAWSGTESSSDLDGGIFFQRFDGLTGNRLGTNVLANSETVGIQTDPAVGVDSGSFVIAWEGPDGGVSRTAGVGPFGGAAPLNDIIARRFDSATGNPLDLDFLVNAATAGNQGHASVAVAFGGEFVIAWTGDDADVRGLFYSAFDAQGTPVPGQSDVQINTTTALNQEDPEVAMDGSGNFVTAWRGEETVSNTEIYAQRYSSPFGVVDLILEAKAEGTLALSPLGLLAGALFGLLAWLRRFTVRR